MHNFIKLGVMVIAFLGLSFTPTPIAAKKPQILNRSCNPVSVGVFSNRIHVRCKVNARKPYTKNIVYYAMAINSRNSKQVDYTLQAILAAHANNILLRIWFDNDDYKSVPGCRLKDCRRLTGVATFRPNG